MHNDISIKENIRQLALNEGFDACGFCDAQPLIAERYFLQTWLEKRYHGTMHYMENHFEKRLSPELLVSNSKTVIVVAQNYFPPQTLQNEEYSIAKFAYGKDYHTVIKNKLYKIVEKNPDLKNDSGLRIFVDSAPILERALAVKAGLGFIGKNGCLIIPEKGSYFLLGEIVTSVAVNPDLPFDTSFCGNCTLCVDACPTHALVAPKTLDARKCNSYLTIEHQGDNNDNKPVGPSIFGCDACQDICPHNRCATPHHESDLLLKQKMQSMKLSDWNHLTKEQFDEIFKDSPLKRSGYDKIKKNIHLIS